MQTRVLVGTDGSVHASSTISYVGAIAADVPTIVVRLLHVMAPYGVALWVHDTRASDEPHMDRYPETYLGRLETWRTDQSKRALRILEQGRALLEEAGVPVDRIETRTVEGDSHRPSRELRLMAEREGFDTIVVGRRGVSMWREFAFGGTTEDLLRYPIGHHLWVIEPDPSQGKRELLLGIDGSENSMRAVDYVAATIGPCPWFRVVLAHVPRRRTMQEAQQILDEACDRLRNRGFAAGRLETRILDPALDTAEALIKDARDNDCGTIVIGRRGRSTLREFVFGGITERLLRYPIGRSVWLVE